MGEWLPLTVRHSSAGKPQGIGDYRVIERFYSVALGTLARLLRKGKVLLDGMLPCDPRYHGTVF